MEIRAFATGVEVSPAAFGRLVTADGERPTLWQVAEETPVAILVNGRNFAVMMATPADLEDFAVGFAITEGIVSSPAEIDGLRIAEAADGIVVNLRISATLVAAADHRRRTLAGRAGCGICGAQTIAAVLPSPRRVLPQPIPSVAALEAAYAGLPVRQRMKRVNRSTHAAALCARSGEILTVREDIGRHNALDKLAGWVARDGIDTGEGFILLSSRISVEMVQKTAAIGVPFLAAVSAPSALALRVADRAGITIAGLAAAGVMIFDVQ